MFYAPMVIATAAAERAQQLQAETTAQSAEQQARSANQKLELMKLDIERLLMISQALWLLAKQAHGYDDKVLTDLIAEIDANDGKLDGRVAPQPPQPCPFCGRTLMKRRPICIYCGKPVSVDPFER